MTLFQFNRNVRVDTYISLRFDLLQLTVELRNVSIKTLAEPLDVEVTFSARLVDRVQNAVDGRSQRLEHSIKLFLTSLYLTPDFHHSVAVLPLPFRRSAVVKFRCSVKIR